MGNAEGLESVEGGEGFNIDLAAGFWEREEAEVGKWGDISLFGG